MPFQYLDTVNEFYAVLQCNLYEIVRNSFIWKIIELPWKRRRYTYREWRRERNAAKTDGIHDFFLYCFPFLIMNHECVQKRNATIVKMVFRSIGDKMEISIYAIVQPTSIASNLPPSTSRPLALTHMDTFFDLTRNFSIGSVSTYTCHLAGWLNASRNDKQSQITGHK